MREQTTYLCGEIKKFASRFLTDFPMITLSCLFSAYAVIIYLACIHIFFLGGKVLWIRYTLQRLRLAYKKRLHKVILKTHTTIFNWL